MYYSVGIYLLEFFFFKDTGEGRWSPRMMGGKGDEKQKQKQKQKAFLSYPGEDFL